MGEMLQGLFRAIARTKNQQEVRSTFMDTIGGYFQAQRWGIYLYSPQGRLLSADMHGIRNAEAFLERYQAVGKAVDPVLKHVATHHTPAHEGWFYTPEEWERSPLYTRCCASLDHAHLMTGPIVGNGKMTGAVHFSRTSGTPAFSNQDLLALSAVCAHLSAQLAFFRRDPTFNSEVYALLTSREVQVAELVMQGLTNAEVGQKLWISEHTVKKILKRIFLKLRVPNRAAMTSKLLS